MVISASRYSFFFLFLSFYVKLLSAKPFTSFSLKKFDQFDPKIALYGDAKVVNGGNFVEINKASNFSDGRLIYGNPIKFLNGKRPISLSTYFSFSISAQNGGGFGFVFLPTGFPLDVFDSEGFGEKDLVVKFDTSGGSYVGIDLGRRRLVWSNSSVVLNSGEKMNCWISYDANSKRLEVRLSEFGGKKPEVPSVSCGIDLAAVWKGEEVFIGMSSSSGNSTQYTSVYSWSLWLRYVPTWLHSQPLNPEEYSVPKKVLVLRRRNVCVFRVVTTVIFGIGCGTLAVFIVLFLKAMFATRHAVVVPVEYPVHTGEFGYKQIMLVVKKDTKDNDKQ